MTKPQFTLQSVLENSTLGKFSIEPLPRGFGDTLGNALRRVLYSSIPGAAITTVRISGANHQFSTIDGVKEDLIQIVLSLKQLHVSYTGEKPVTLTLSAKGAGVVTAKSFEVPASVEIVNPDLVLAHLADKNAKLEIEATVESGIGYSPAEDRKSTTVGVIPIDALFTPVMRVNYDVVDTRVGRVTDFDKLNIEITTDGTVSPKNALTQAAQTLVEYFQSVVNPTVIDPSVDAAVGNASSAAAVAGGHISIEELDLPTRIANALQHAGVETVADLLAISKADLSKVKNLGGKSVGIIEASLKERNFELA
jgi:DNA-directed RNA polymerase subunit alpha